MFANLDHTHMSIWGALGQYSGLREYEAALFDPGSSLLDPDMPLMQHALQVCARTRAPARVSVCACVFEFTCPCRLYCFPAPDMLLAQQT
jgi:hypothetical protein